MGASGNKEERNEMKKKELKNELKNEIKNELKNEPKIDGKNEVIIGSKPIPLKIANKVNKAICKITIETNEGIAHGTGFFLNYSDSKKFLMTCYHVINPNLENNKIELEIYDKKVMQLKFKNRFTKYMDRPEDIAMIEIKESDEIYNEVEYLNYDKNFIDSGYLIYKEADIFSVEHPGGDDASCASGKIIDIYNNEFEHDIGTENGSSGCPILLLNNNINLIRVIGIHKQGINTKNRKINYGTFIGEILNKELNKKLNNNLNKELNEKINDNKNNYIIAEIDIKDKDINKNIRIINSYEEYLRNGKDKDKILKDTKFNNEEEIKNSEIKINEEIIKFNYFYKFKSKGKYIIKYIFKNKIKNLCLIFGDCESIININLSNFNTDNLTNMNGMF